MHFIGKIDMNIYKPISDKILSDEVIITDERIQHIVERRGQVFYDEYYDYFPEIINAPDYIFRDEHKNSALVCKSFTHKGTSVNLVVRLVVEGNNPQFKNSVITAVKENNKRFEQRLRNHTPIYCRFDNT